jgi:type I restriction enzyme S subunit
VYISHETNAEQRKSRIFPGDVVVVRTGQVGVAAIVTPEFDGANCIDLLIVRKSTKVLSEYLLTYLNSWPARTDVQCRAVGAIQAHYNTSTLANLVIAAPPIPEQQRILDDLRLQFLPIDDLELLAQREIALLREYRTRLISDVVTGKLDVREAATRLPDEAEQPELLDDAGAFAEDGGEETETTGLDAALEEAEA